MIKQNNFFIKISLLIFIFLFVSTTNANRLDHTKGTQLCSIENYKYKNEYLYSLFGYQMDRRRIFINKIDRAYVKSVDQYAWIFEPVDWLNDTYYITNLQYNSYHLCAGHMFMDILNQRRYLTLNNLNEQSLKTNKKCMWRVKYDSTRNSYQIWNAYFKEAIYATKFILSTLIQSTYRRNVFMWNGRPDSLQFDWKLICVKV